MSIESNIKAVKRKILGEIDEADHTFSDGLKRKAIAAINKGVGSPEWETYMTEFADASRPEQLARLMATDGTAGDDDFDTARAYLVADAPCTTWTILNFGRAASALLDQGLPPDSPAPPAPEPGPQ